MSTTTRIPDLGANPIEDALRNYQQMEHDLGLARSELGEKNDMLHRLMQENEFLRRNHDKAVLERDRFQALAVNLATRAVGVKEAVERLLVEAMKAGAAPADDRQRTEGPAFTGEAFTQEMERMLRIPAGGKAEPVREISAAVARGMSSGATVPPANQFS